MFINIRLNTTCNLSCDHCYNHNIWDKPIIPNISEKIIHFFEKNNIHPNHIYIHGGEPLLPSMYNELSKIISYFKKQDTYIEIISNLTVNIDNIIPLLKDCNMVRTSFDNRIRFKTMKNLLTWKRNVQLLHDMQIKTQLVMTLHRYNLCKSPKQVAKFIYHMNFDFISFEMLIPCKNYNNLSMPQSFINTWISEFRKYYNISNFPFYKNRNFQNCCKNTIVIAEDGLIYDCLSDKNPTVFSLDSNIEDILSYKDQMKYIPPNYCLSCDKYDICGGGCPNYHIDGMKRCPYNISED